MTTWNYDASLNTLAATFASTNGVKYELSSNDPNSGFASATASGSTLTLTATGIASSPAGDFFDAYINTAFPNPFGYIDSSVFKIGTTSSGESLDATWAYNGTTGFSCEFAAPDIGNSYQLIVEYLNGGSFANTAGGSVSGTTDTTCTVTAGSAIDASSIIRLKLEDVTTFRVHAVRMFVGGTSGAGTAGSPGGAFAGGGETWSDDVSSGAGGIRVGVAFDDPALEPNPTWTDLTALQPTLIASYDIERGRQYELDITDAGTCSVIVKDRHGVMDPTNSFGPYYTKIEPDLQIRIDLWNPVAEEWQMRYRGWIEDWDWDLSEIQNFFSLTISCYDIFALLTAIEMQPGAFGDVPVEPGTVFFDNADFQTRIIQVLGNAGIPSDFYVVFTGNVELLEGTYSPGEDPMQPIQDCVDAEFPGVANVYPDRFGRLAAHGRLANFDPDGVSAGATAGAWLFRDWKVGDEFAFISDGDNVQMRPPFTFNRGKSKIINSALCYPADIADADIAGQLVQDAVSIGLRGFKSWSKEHILVKTGLLTGNTGKDEAKLYGTFYVANAAEPLDRITALTVKSLSPDDARAANVWDMLCNSDIADRVNVTVTHPGDESGHGGFNLEPFFLQGIRETATPLTPDYAFVTQSYDLSPAALFTNPEGLDGN